METVLTPNGPVAGAPSDLTDEMVVGCIASTDKISESSKTVYKKQLRGMVAAFGTVGAVNPIVSCILDAEVVVPRILAASCPDNTKLSYIKAVLSVYKHAACMQRQELAGVKATWQEGCKLICERLASQADQNRKTAREESAWVSLPQFLAKERELAASDDAGSQAHLLLAYTCLQPPLRGGDGACVRIVPPGHPLVAAPTQNVLIWAGVDMPSQLVIKTHKTAHIYGHLVRVMPKVLRERIALSLRRMPREWLFVPNTRGAVQGYDCFQCVVRTRFFQALRGAMHDKYMSSCLSERHRSWRA